MEKSIFNPKKKVNISEMPPNKNFEDYAEDMIFVLDETDDENWEDVELED